MRMAAIKSIKITKILWILAGITALGLTVASVRFMVLTNESEDLIGKRVFIAGNQQLSLLRDSARTNAQVVAIIERGASVTITQVDSDGVRPWVYVESEAGSGWIEAAALSESPP